MCLNCGVKKSKMLNTKETIKMPIICGQIHIDLFEAALFCVFFLKKKVVVRPIYHEIPSLTEGNTYLYLLPQNKAFHE